MTPAERARHVARTRERIAEQVRTWGHVLDDETAALLEEIDLLTAGPQTEIPDVDVCAWCWDSECDGISCIAGLDVDDPDDHEAIERLHLLLREGRRVVDAP